MAKVKCESAFTQLDKLNVREARKLTINGQEVPVIDPAYFTSCFTATFATANSFSVAGNQVEQFQIGRQIQLDSGQDQINCGKNVNDLTPDDIYTVNKYDYSIITDVSWDGVLTTVTIADSILTSDLEDVCLSVNYPVQTNLTTTELINSSTGYPLEAVIKTTGYTTAGDGGGAEWVQNGVFAQTASQSPAQLVDGLLNDAAGNQWVLVEPTGLVSVLKLGAVNNGIADCLAPFNAAWQYCITNAKSFYMPGGSYFLSGEFVADYSHHTVETDEDMPDIIGAGRGVTEVRGTFGGNLIKIQGGLTGAAVHINATIQGFKCVSTNGTGIYHEIGSFTTYRDLFFVGCDDCIIFEDAATLLLDSIICRFNTRGLTFNTKVSVTFPNAITMLRCHIAHCSEYGVLNNGGTLMNMYGGTIEKNGTTTGATGEWGVKIIDSGLNGEVGLYMDGVYVEGNGGNADVWIVSGPQNCNHSIRNTTFNRVAAAKYTNFNIRVDQSDGSGDLTPTLLVDGCSFAGFNDYAPDAANKYIKTFADRVALYTSANSYESSLEVPIQLEGVSFCAVSFNGTLADPISPNRSRNSTSTITKVATGRYQINLAKESRGNLYFNGRVNGAGYIEKFAETNNSITINTRDSAGTLTDYSDVFLEFFN